MKALQIEVFKRSGADCTNNGISSRFNELLLLCESGFIDVDEENPPQNLVRLKCRYLFGENHYSIEPVKQPDGAGWMMGGNYAACSDSRFWDMVGRAHGAVAIHDRQESWKQYNSMD